MERWFLRSDLSVECDVGTHAAFAPLAWFMLGVYSLGIPLTGFLIIRRSIASITYTISLPCAVHFSRPLVDLDDAVRNR